MTSGFEKPISIKKAISCIDRREFLLPALQRQFVWNAYQIEVLFDSIMRNYPINSFMLWKVTESSIKNNLKFYEFLKKYKQRYAELNPEFSTKGHDDFYAVIDGQQRLTSIYIGLKGSYAYKAPKKWWKDDEECLPTRYLYIDISSELPEDNDQKAKYLFRFLTTNDLEFQSSRHPERIWYKVGDILTIESRNDLDNFIEEKELLSNRFAKETIRQLWTVIHEKELLNYYLELNQDLSIVLDIFIRTNSGGEPLSFSDLLMSLITASWKKLDARQEIPDLINKVFNIRGREFTINKDFVLKTCLVLLNDNIKFQIKNFDETNVVNFEQHWLGIKKAIIAGFGLVANLGLSNYTLRAKNAVIPIIYFIYKKGITDEINHVLKYKDDKILIHKWINVSLLKGVFGGQSDNVLTRIRKVINSQIEPILDELKVVSDEKKKKELEDKLKAVSFPLSQISAEFAADPAKNLTFDDAFIDELLRVQYDSTESNLILALLYPHLDYFNQDVHKDHLHNADFFKKIDPLNTKILPEDIDYCKDANNWNSILNLQMLNSSLNISKKDKLLKDWVTETKVDLGTQIIPENINLDILNFKEFIEKRKSILHEKIKSLV